MREDMFKFIKNISIKREERVRRVENERLRKEKERIEKERIEKEKAEKEKIRKEEEQRKIDELVKEQYNKDVKNMSLKFGEYAFNIMCNVFTMRMETVEKAVIIDFKNIKKFFKFVYRETYSITKLDEFVEYAKKNIGKIILEKLEHDFRYNYDEPYFDEETKQKVKKELLEEFNNQTKSYNFKSYVYNILDDTKEFSYENKLIDKIMETYQKDQDEDFNRTFMLDDTLLSYNPFAKYVVSSLICLYSFLMGIMFLVVLSRQKNYFMENEELFKIADNLYGQFDDEEALNKLFPIYEGIYNGMLTGLYTGESSSFYNKQILGVLTTFSCDNMESYRSLRILSLEKEAKERGLLENIETINYEVLKDIMYKYINTDLNSKYYFGYYYLFILFEYRDKIKADDLLYYIWQSWDIEVEVKDKKKKEDLINEKERFLNGNFDKEKDVENEKLKFNSVKTGIEFEEYLKYIFEKKGYSVELTKATGDQGADLIITKNDIKTVVQAKFYSNTVGNKAVQEVVSAIKYYNADSGMVVTNNYYTKSAIELANVNNIVLWDSDILNGKVNELYC